ncbi:MBL fold metallo-hydrolase [Marinobacter sp. Arc7-DN-1]|uniref:MBL fold metallo-hydrolase n=1 Tax=Marinobacter sp. Arc7-DN-1 TaxID=2304594 RepID=UPI000E45089D|nr:MBL fold metallo-hydrolase [Marinobacter sp. Arc7-DN-1]AXS81888.1 MBL fold metallo-hydrolase [Marinobacter sp. Arc7-DN-1]
MGYEVDFLGTNSETKSGDAIAMRFGNLHGTRADQVVIVIDGGFTQDGTKVVEHIKSHYKTTKVDLVISTHPDQDHINGLAEVLEELEVGELWLHLPWEHNSGLASKFQDGRFTDNSLGERLRESLNRAHLLFELAKSRGIPIREPFTGLTHSSRAVKVLGPTLEYYESLIPEFDGMPAKANDSMPEGLLRKAGAMMKRLFAVWGNDHIDDNGVTSPKNNTSVITQIVVDGKRLVFTGDSGIDALHHAADEIDACIDSASLSFIQVPHHGSRRNVGPTVLNRLIGSPVQEGERRPITAIAPPLSR